MNKGSLWFVLFFMHVAACLTSSGVPALRALPHPCYRFLEITGHSPHFQTVRQAFCDTIQPLYENQTKALAQIASSTDRTCKLLMDTQDKPMGILVFKKEPNNEYEKFSVKNSLEIKALFVINPEQNKGKGVGTALIQEAKKQAIKANASSMHLTASEAAGDRKGDVIRFFEHKGFEKPGCSWPQGDAFPLGTEHLLVFKKLYSDRED
ncbi:N-acetyltransferase [bacterium NHP-B]|nr:N-acetyltransferase [bacterium NHP-B]